MIGGGKKERKEGRKGSSRLVSHFSLTSLLTVTCEEAPQYLKYSLENLRMKNLNMDKPWKPEEKRVDTIM